MERYIREICDELEFPKEAADAMSDAWKAMMERGQYELWLSWINRYEEEGPEMDFELAIEMIREAAPMAGVHPYRAELLLFLMFCRHLRDLYIEQGISLQIWHDSCMDLHWKLMECKKLYGIWGSFVSWWFSGFFEMKRFAVGRLQFELIGFPWEYEEAGYTKPVGMECAIGVHIPSGKRLKRVECIASYRQAAELFSKVFPEEFGGKTIAFCCDSWLLFELHRAFLKPDSGIVEFMNDYEVYRTEYGYGDLWRIFNCGYNGNPDALPEDTSLQRGYKELLKRNEKPGCGYGIFFLDQIKV